MTQSDMTDIAIGLNNLPPGEVKDEILHFLRTVGVREALFAAVEMIRDKKTPAAARATLINAVFKIAGLLKKPAEADDPYGLAKMTGPEMLAFMNKTNAGASRLDREMQERRRLIDQLRVANDVFA